MLAIIVPFRGKFGSERHAQLNVFIAHITSFLIKSTVIFRIFVINESSEQTRLFNRGVLLNIGYVIARSSGFKHVVFHDVDLIPSIELSYCYQRQEKAPVHIARLWGRYSQNKYYVGGITLWDVFEFEKINGFPNNFWGWGGEDDEMMLRCISIYGKNFLMSMPACKGAIIVDLENKDLNEKLASLRNSSQKCTNKWELLKEHKRTWRHNGLSNLQYVVTDKLNLGRFAQINTVRF